MLEYVDKPIDFKETSLLLRMELRHAGMGRASSNF